MLDNYPEAVSTLFDLEGYESNVKGDPGGRTILGVAERYWPEDVANMIPLSETDRKLYAREFYYKNFWLPFKCNERVYPDDIITFTIAVNNGRIPYDSDSWEGDLLGSLVRYIELCRDNPKMEKFKKGWENRIIKLFKTYHKAAKGQG